VAFGNNNMSEMTDAQRRRVAQYMSLDTDALVSLIPPYLPRYEGSLFAPVGQVRAGWEEFDKLKLILTPILCVDWDLCRKIKSKQYEDAVSLISAIADVIAAHSGFVPPFLASTIIVKMGVRRLCNCPE
jgi:hypothetical protein